MTAVLQLLGQIARAASVDAVWGLVVPYYRELGFARVNYTYSRFLTKNSIGDPDDALFLTTNSPEYIKTYLHDGFYSKTPLFRWVLNNEGACTWRWVHEFYKAGKLTPTEAEAVRTNIAMGVVAGITISFTSGSARSKAGLGLIADVDLTHDDVDRIWAEAGAEILSVANMMHLKISQLPQKNGRRTLTERQREALGWVADGKTSQDIATIMGVSVAMVEKHLRLAREALDVETTAQAVAKATLLNQILSDSEVLADDSVWPDDNGT